MSDEIYNKMNLAPMKSVELVATDKNSDDLEDDLDEVRYNIRALIDKGEKSLEELIDLSSRSQDVKAYREFSVLVKVLLEANDKLIETAKTRKELARTEKSGGSVNNNLFIGTTTEALNFLNSAKDDKDVIDGDFTDG